MDTPHISLSPLPKAFSSEMLDPSGTRSLPPLSPHGDYEGFTGYPKKPRAPSVFSRLANVIIGSPFLSTTLFYLFLAGATAGVAKWSYSLGVRNPDNELRPNESGVSVSLASLALVGFELTPCIADRTRWA